MDSYVKIMDNNSPRHLLITGAANGLGKATALHFARQGWRVTATDIDQEGLGKLTGLEGITIRLMDVTSDASVSSVFTELEQAGSPLDLIINNAGIDRYIPFSEAPADTFREIFEINLFGAYRVNQVFLPILNVPGGRIIQIGSESHHLALPFMPYPLTKRAVESYSLSLRQELKFKGIDVVIVRPGAIDTAFIKNLSCIRHLEALRRSRDIGTVSDPAVAKAFETFADSVPGEVGRVVAPEKVAAFIYRISGIRHPASVYRINNDLKLRLSAFIPFRILEKIIHCRLT